MTIRLITLTGPSGTGKTTIMKRLLESTDAPFSMIQSTTTREPRQSDIPGEYEYVSPDDFVTIEKQGDFLWTADVTGKRYGTRRSYVDAILTGSDKVGMMILVPEVVPILQKYVDEKGMRSSCLFVYIRALPDDVLKKRMKIRGDTHDDIVARLALSREWDAKARAMGCFDVFIKNEDENGLPGRIVAGNIIRRVCGETQPPLS